MPSNSRVTVARSGASSHVDPIPSSASNLAHPEGAKRAGTTKERGVAPRQELTATHLGWVFDPVVRSWAVGRRPR